MGLDADQQAILEDYDGARCVLAGPGSGKTSVLVAFFKKLSGDGVPSDQIRCVTFSKEAAATMEKRSPVDGKFSTFHALGYSICLEKHHQPVEPELRHRLLSKLTRKYHLDYKEFEAFIARMRHQGVTVDSILDTDEDWGSQRAYAEYEKTRAQEGWIDFESMVLDAVKYLEEDSVLRRRWQAQYMLVDEAQDTDDSQFRLAQLLTEQHGNITVVGDFNQAMYGFRGARPENLANFRKWFPKGRYYYLGSNYRSTLRIVSFVRDNLPVTSPPEMRERMVAARSEEGLPVAFKMFQNENDEAEDALAQAGKAPLQSAILARTNHLVGVLERLCQKHNVRYHLNGRTGFWKRAEIRKAIEALKEHSQLTTAQAVSLVLPRLEARYAVADRTEADDDAVESLKTLGNISRDFHGCREFLTYANKMIHRRNDPKGVTISTIHQSKGGQWGSVYLIGVKAKCIPHQHGDADEEQRIYFVGISRAIDSLRISFSGTPSQYLRKYITEDVWVALQSKAGEVDRLQEQARLF